MKKKCQRKVLKADNDKRKKDGPQKNVEHLLKKRKRKKNTN